MAFCTYCGTAVSESVGVCPKCGHPQNVPAASAEAIGTLSGGRRTEGKAVASLVLGIVGLVMCPFIPSIIAVILGNQARAKIAADPGLEGDALARAGVICGWVGIALTALAVIAVVLLIAFGGASSFGPDFDFSV